MKGLRRNKKKLYYALYIGRNSIVDEDGNDTGEYEKMYDDPVEIMANLSASKGTVSEDVFGAELDYTRSLSTCDELPINEYSLIWHETEPSYRKDGYVDESTADYSVVQVAKSLNATVYALKKRAKNEVEQ